MTTTANVKCGKCDGAGTLSWTRCANGVCFQCNGAGVLSVTSEVAKAIKAPRAANIAAIKRDLDELASDYTSDTFYGLAANIARAEDDVAARAFAAVERIAGAATLHNIKRQVESFKSMAIVKAVRKVA